MTQAEEQRQMVAMQQSAQQSMQLQLMFEDITDSVYHLLKGELQMMDENGNPYYQKLPGMKQLLNDHGISQVLLQIQARCNRIFIMTDLEEEYIKKIALGMGDDIRKDFFDNWEKYEIESESDASKALNIVFDQVFAVLMRSRKGTYLKYMQTVSRIQETQSHSDTGENQNKGGLSSWISWGRR